MCSLLVQLVFLGECCHNIMPKKGANVLAYLPSKDLTSVALNHLNINRSVQSALIMNIISVGY